MRNVVFLGHVDHGKSTLINCLAYHAGLIDENESNPYTATTTEEIERFITIHGTVAHFIFDEKKFSVLDSPGLTDFIGEAQVMMRLADGAILAVDSVEGHMVTTENHIKLALGERLKCRLMVNKIDRLFLELSLDGEAAYQTLKSVIDGVNLSFATFSGAVTDAQVFPELNHVVFGSGLGQYGFSLQRFAKMYAAKFGLKEEVLCKKLWGNNYFDPEARKWINNDKNGTLSRGFTQFIWKPIQQLQDLIMNQKIDEAKSVAEKLGITMEWTGVVGKRLLHRALRTWLPLAEELIQLMLDLPSPLTAQKDRCSVVASESSSYFEALRTCDPQGPLVVFCGKTFRGKEGNFAVARVFSGTIRRGQEVFFSNELSKRSNAVVVDELGIISRDTFTPVEEAVAGMIIAIPAVTRYLLKQGTITDGQDMMELKCVRFMASPLISVVISPKQAQHLPHLIEEVRQMNKMDPLIRSEQDNAGELIVSGIGELHLEMNLNRLYASETPFLVSTPFAQYKETCESRSEKITLSKSPNKHNRIYMVSEPMADLAESIEQGNFDVEEDFKSRGKKLVDLYGWDIGESRKIWSFGPEMTGPNCLVDQTKGVQFLNEIKDSCVAAFQWVMREGPLCEEPCYGIKSNIVDVTMNADAIHRGGGQIIPCTRRCILGSIREAEPTLMEPMYLVEVSFVGEHMGNLIELLNKRRGNVFDTIKRPDSPMEIVRAYLPVSESFGFQQELRMKTSGMGFAQSYFDHWQVMMGPVTDENSPCYEVVRQVRRRRGLKEELPPISLYSDNM